MLKKRVDYGFSGYQVPVIPRAPRSIRRRSSNKKVVEDTRICAFELLAAVAGKLLQESKSSSTLDNPLAGDQLIIGKDAIKSELQKDEPLNAECFGQGSSQKSVKTLVYQSKKGYRNFPSKFEVGSPGYGESCSGKTEIDTENKMEAKEAERKFSANEDTKDQMDLCVKFPPPDSSDSSVELPSLDTPIQDDISMWHGNVGREVRDGDDNSSVFIKAGNTKIKAVNPLRGIGARKIRKLLTSKYWNAAPKLKDCENSYSDGGKKPMCRSRKRSDIPKRSHCETHSKRRKVFARSSIVASEGVISSESFSNSPDKRGSAAMLQGGAMLQASGASSSTSNHQASIRSSDPRVKLSIKSFSIPELFIEVPETVTVASLKRTVVEAVSTLLGDGLHVGILVGGKKLRDDSKTLQQTGICHDVELDTLDFTLEPNQAQIYRSFCSEDPRLLLQCDTPQLLNRLPVKPVSNSGLVGASTEPPLATDCSNYVDHNINESVPSSTDMLTKKTTPDYGAVVAVSDVRVETLAMVPYNNQKNRTAEFVQRRTRRPFSVSEVEALVEAVEKLGTGRWRDVKLRAFDYANHRTYVDLKDKWKTLVHTAKISPQQRRGEPVPQELLDRVLAAHAYWSQQQAKQQGNHHSVTLPKVAEAQETDGGLSLQYKEVSV